MTTVMVTIGRNIGATPMPALDWEAMQDRVAMAMSAHVGTPDTLHTGIGVWDGVSEDSVILTCIEAISEGVRDLALVLAYLAGQYSQDAIALNVSDTTLCTAPS